MRISAEIWDIGLRDMELRDMGFRVGSRAMGGVSTHYHHLRSQRGGVGCAVSVGLRV